MLPSGQDGLSLGTMVDSTTYYYTKKLCTNHTSIGILPDERFSFGYEFVALSYTVDVSWSTSESIELRPQFADESSGGAKKSDLKRTVVACMSPNARAE